jgi:hypothetical protein
MVEELVVRTLTAVEHHRVAFEILNKNATDIPVLGRHHRPRAQKHDFGVDFAEVNVWRVVVWRNCALL